MAAPISATKTLNGVVTLTPLLGATNYYFSVPNPNTLVTEVLNEVYIHCDSTLGAIGIYLPNIASIKTFGAKVYVVDVASAATANNITIYADAGTVGPPVVPANTIDALSQVAITLNGGICSLCIVSNTQWQSFLS